MSPRTATIRPLGTPSRQWKGLQSSMIKTMLGMIVVVGMIFGGAQAATAAPGAPTPLAAEASESDESLGATGSDAAAYQGQPGYSAAPAEEASLSDAEEAQVRALLSGADQDARQFNASIAEAKGATPDGIADFAATVESLGWTVVGHVDDSTVSSSAQSAIQAASSCTGKSGYVGYFGSFWQFALNSCQTDMLISIVAAGAASYEAIAAILAAAGVTAPAAAIVAAVGAVTALGAAALGICKAASYGVHAIYLNIMVPPIVPPATCWGQ